MNGKIIIPRRKCFD